MGKLIWTLTLLLVAPGALAAQEVCDDINVMADGWNEIANIVDELGAEGMTEDEAAEIDAAITESLESTEELAKTLQESGDGVIVELADRLLDDLDTLDSAETLDDIVDAIDAIVEDLDALVDDCDAATGDASPSAAGGTIKIGYERPQDAAGEELATLIRDSGMFEEIAALVSEVLVLPRDLPAVFASCGQPNAFYRSDVGQVTMCWEFFVLFANIFASQAPQERIQSVLDTGAFFFLHEVGHALVHQLDIPVTGREEDSVDTLATLILLQSDGPEALIAALVNFEALAAMEDQGGLAFWGEHSLSAQRLYDMACLVYGSDPRKHAGLVGPDLLPAERAQRCPGEYDQKDRAWDQLLGPYYAQP